jgi:hypothetical protein
MIVVKYLLRLKETGESPERIKQCRDVVMDVMKMIVFILVQNPLFPLRQKTILTRASRNPCTVAYQYD